MKLENVPVQSESKFVKFGEPVSLFGKAPKGAKELRAIRMPEELTGGMVVLALKVAGVHRTGASLPYWAREFAPKSKWPLWNFPVKEGDEIEFIIERVEVSGHYKDWTACAFMFLCEVPDA